MLHWMVTRELKISNWTWWIYTILWTWSLVHCSFLKMCFILLFVLFYFLCKNGIWPFLALSRLNSKVGNRDLVNVFGKLCLVEFLCFRRIMILKMLCLTDNSWNIFKITRSRQHIKLACVMYPVLDTDGWMCWIINVESFETGSVNLIPRLSHHNVHKLFWL